METEKTFEIALKDLEDIVRKMETGNLPLDDLLGSFEQGIGLLRFCEKKLGEAEGKIAVLGKDEPFQSVDERDAVPENPVNAGEYLSENVIPEPVPCDDIDNTSGYVAADEIPLPDYPDEENVVEYIPEEDIPLPPVPEELPDNYKAPDDEDLPEEDAPEEEVDPDVAFHFSAEYDSLF